MDADELNQDEQLDFGDPAEEQDHFDNGEDGGYEEEQLLQYDDDAQYDEGEGLACTEDMQEGADHAADDADEEYLQGLQGEGEQQCVSFPASCIC